MEILPDRAGGLWKRLWRIAVAASIGLGGALGCQRPAPSNTDQPQTGPAQSEQASPPGSRPVEAPTGQFPSAETLLQEMVAAYKRAHTYSDRGVLKLEETAGGQKQERPVDYAVIFERPNRLRMHVLRGAVVCDGTSFHAHFPEWGEQLVKRPAPPRITPGFLLSDAIFAAALSEGAPTHFCTLPPPLILLLAGDPLKTILHQSTKPRLLEPAKIGDNPCYRVELVRPDGNAVLWIDQASLVLRRIELPINQIKKDAAEYKVEVHSWVAEFQDAAFDQPIDAAAFQIELPSQVQIVECFMPPPLLLLNKPAPAFRFVGLDGKPVGPSALEGKVALLEFWATYCDPCRVTMPLLEKVYQKYKDHPKVAFLAVSVDEQGASDQEVQTKMAQWGATLPVVRDPERDAGQKFGIRSIPAMCALGADGTLQDYWEGFRPNLDTELAAKIERLLAGQNLSQEPLRRWEEERQEYLASLDSWVGQELFAAAEAEALAPSKAQIAEPTKPKAFALSPLWKCTDLQQPGNLLVVAEPDSPPKLLVIDSWKTVVEVSPDGKKTIPHLLDIGREEGATFLRTAADASQRRYYLVSGRAGPRVYLFDETWKRLLSLPEVASDSQPPEISDAQLADLDGDGRPEILISYFQGGGVQAFSLDGKELWHYRELKLPSRVCVLAEAPNSPPTILSTNELGTLVRLDAHGKRLDEMVFDGKLINWVVAAELSGDRTPELCGLFLADPDTRVALVLDAKGNQKATYALPKGIDPGTVEQIIPGHLTAQGPGCWLLPGADGSIHVLDPDGRLVDRFNYGGAVTGLASLVLDGRPVLVVATPQTLEAWEVRWPERQ
ncbi:MAG: redoxin domain-containing protein [Thermoguttaceae bacterium]